MLVSSAETIGLPVHASWESNVMPLRPLHARILVQRVEECDPQVGGVIIPDTAMEKPQLGEVIAAGNRDVRSQNRQSVYRDPTAVSEVSRLS
jgi:hypothetical protein